MGTRFIKQSKAFRRGIATLAATGVAAVPVAMAVGATARPAQAGNDTPPPSLEHDLDATRFDDGSRAIMIRIEQAPDPGDVRRVDLVKARAYVRRGDEGPIQVETFDYDGNRIDSWKAVRPTDGGGEVLRTDEGRYAIPYTKNLAVVTITDRRSNVQTPVKVGRAVHDFCAVNPTDVACDQVDLIADLRMDDYSARTLAVGESVEVLVKGIFTNQLGETNGAVGVIDPMYVGRNLSFTTEDKTVVTFGRIDGAFREVVGVAYKLTCNAPGTDRIFPEARIGATGGEHVVEVNPNNNHWNTYFDVNCV
ncbi:MAG: hypothetical protein AB7L13_17925 [Acidimicrobiia bacterium]